MKFKISRENFLKPLQLVVGVVERRQTLPILSNVLIILKDSRLSLTGTDLEVEIVGHINLSATAEDGEITVPARKLMDICKSLPEATDLTLNEKDGRVQIISGRSHFTLSSLPANEFPSVDDGATGETFAIKHTELKRLIDRTSFAMAQQDVRYYLNGMLLEVSDGRLRAVATDGHRLAMMDSEKIEFSSDKIQAIIPRKAVMELSRLLLDEGQVTVALSDNHIQVVAEDFRFTSKLVDGAYPDYDRVVPKGGDKQLVGLREDLRSGFSRAAILSNEKYRSVKLILAQDLLTLVASNPEQEEAREEVTVKYDSTELELGFNVSYIIDILNILSGKDVCFTFSDANSSVLIEDPEQQDAVYVVMPMRL